jgi:hypothetical protein
MFTPYYLVLGSEHALFLRRTECFTTEETLKNWSQVCYFYRYLLMQAFLKPATEQLQFSLSLDQHTLVNGSAIVSGFVFIGLFYTLNHKESIL